MSSRESILARLFEIGSDIHEWGLAGRNLPAIPPDSLPAFVMWDGPQSRLETQTAQPAYGLVQFRVEMTPTLAIAFSGDQDTIGSGANALHDELMHAVLSDTELYSLLEHRQVKYIDTDFVVLPNTEEPALALYLNFALRFVLKPSELISA